MQNAEHFNVDRIIKIVVVDKQKDSYAWLPKKQKTWFFGLFKRKSWYSEGFYPSGCYDECYECGCWEANASTKESLIKYGYIVDSQNIVWRKPYVTLYLESSYSVTQKFDTIEQANEWVDELKSLGVKTFEIVR
jgi:hypothetical protein